jgi:pimeloyl-ACP methyl ester carboxylesterase
MPLELAFLVLFILYLLVGFGLYATQDFFIFPRRVNLIPALDETAAGMEHVSLMTPDGATLNGLLYAGRHPAAPLVLLFGGNAHDVTGMVRFVHGVLGPRFTVAGFSYRGYPNVLGRPSTGKPSEKVLKADALRIHDALVDRFQPGRVMTVGYSLGSAMATHLSTKRQLDALVLVAPFASIARIAQKRFRVYPVPLMLRHPFHLERELARRLKVPTTVIYSPEDGLISIQHIGRLKKVAPKAAFIALDPPPAHIDVLNHPDIPGLLRKALGA